MNDERKKKIDETINLIVGVMNIIDRNENEALGNTIRDILYFAEETKIKRKAGEKS
jgi:hypothetical protein